MDKHVLLSSGQTLIAVHSKQDCVPKKACPLHNPSNHRLVNNPLYYNGNLSIWERILPHSKESVPDPDNLAFQSGAKEIIYFNCAECIHCGEVVASNSRHDYRSCYCGKFAVDGGHDYLRRVGGPFIERSVVKRNPVL